MTRMPLKRVLLIAASAVATSGGPALAQDFVGPVNIGGYLVNGGGVPGAGIGYHNGSFGGYGGYGGFRGGGFGPYGGFNGVGFRGYRLGVLGGYPSFEVVTSSARPPAFQPPHLITPHPGGPGPGADAGRDAGAGGVRYRGAKGGARAAGAGRAVGADFQAGGPRAVGASRAHGASPMRPYGFNAYGRYHGDWLHGYWNGNRGAAWGWRSPYWGLGGYGLGMGLGWGIPAWGYGSSLYGMGYAPYMNPYYADALAATSPYDYARPIDTAAAPVDEAAAAPAEALFEAGRAAFERGNYDEALKQADEALKQLPNDTALHEFRGACLFALGRYDEAAATLYAVLSVGPGWDWTTMVGLYPSVEVYTTQLRVLEAFCGANDSAQAWFVLAYQYLTQGFTDAAVKALRSVVAINPADALSARLLKQLDAPQPDAGAAQAAAPPSPADAAPPEGAAINGTWTASPAAGVTVTLTIAENGAFTWTAAVKDRGRPQTFTGKSTYGDGLLALVQHQGPAMVGRVSWADADHMTFRIVGEGPDAPGLRFSR